MKSWYEEFNSKCVSKHELFDPVLELVDLSLDGDIVCLEDGASDDGPRDPACPSQCCLARNEQVGHILPVFTNTYFILAEKRQMQHDFQRLCVLR